MKRDPRRSTYEELRNASRTRELASGPEPHRPRWPRDDMAKARTQKHISNSFLGALYVAERIAGPVFPQCAYSWESFEENAFHPTIASKIIGLAFLSVVAAWEEFVEESFLRYMAGATSESGYAPELLVGSCRNRTHAMKVLTAAFGESVGARNLRWHDFDWVQHVGKVFFRNGDPYTRVDRRFIQWLKDASTIRNRVAHNSKKARAAFKRLANKHFGVSPEAPLPTGFSPGQLLVCSIRTEEDRLLIHEELRSDWDCLFVAYLNVFEHLRFTLTPFLIDPHECPPNLRGV